jgi:hypothetical protein
MNPSASAYVALAQCVLILHLAFVAWGLFGAAFTRQSRFATQLHAATLIYGVFITWADLLSQGRVECPLTWLENRLLHEAGVAPHQTWFLMRLLLWVGRPSLHPASIPTWGLAAATLTVALLNLSIHWRRHRARCRGEAALASRTPPRRLSSRDGGAVASESRSVGGRAAL